MEGQVEHELKVNAPAGEVWQIYGTLKFSEIICELLPHLVQKVELLEGDGGVGTVVNVVFPPGTPMYTSWKEKFTKIDDEKRVKVAEVIEGGPLDHGFSLYRVHLEIIETGADSSIIKSVVEYKVDTEANASLASTQALEIIAEAIKKYLSEKKV
ncbi:hypothetical protein ACHQM5_004347 [Ranunculus cassubicifolius]